MWQIILEMRRNATEGLFHLQLSRVLDATFFWCARAGKDGGKSYRQKNTKDQILLLLLLDFNELQLVRFKMVLWDKSDINWDLVSL